MMSLASTSNLGLAFERHASGNNTQRVLRPKMLKRGLLFEVIDWDEGQAKLLFGK
jgi:hypothetical protein